MSIAIIAAISHVNCFFIFGVLCCD
jgi:hypothetical protein